MCERSVVRNTFSKRQVRVHPFVSVVEQTMEPSSTRRVRPNGPELFTAVRSWRGKFAPMRLRTLLSRPYTPAATGWRMVRTAVLFGLFVCLFLAVFTPFGLSDSPSGRWLAALCYGAITTLVLLALNGLFPRLFPEWFAAERWTVSRELAWVLCNVAAIAAGNLVFSMVVGFVPYTWGWAMQFLGYTLAVAVFPVCLLVLFKERRLSAAYEKGSVEVNAAMASAPAATLPMDKEQVANATGAVIIPSENGKEDITLAPEQLLFIRSAANYLEVYVQAGKKVERTVIRGSLKAVESALAEHPRLLRCHKSHLVNLDRVQRVSGNAQGYKMHLAEGLDAVPLSRSLNDRLAGLLTARP